jgi:hypothetical protein
MQLPSVPRKLRGQNEKLVIAAQAGPADAGHSLMVSRFLPTPKTS